MTERGEGESGVKLNDRRGFEQRSERHDRTLGAIARRLERAMRA